MTGLKAFIGIKYHQGLNILYPTDTIYLFNILIASSNILWPINFKYVDMILLVITGSLHALDGIKIQNFNMDSGLNFMKSLLQKDQLPTHFLR